MAEGAKRHFPVGGYKLELNKVMVERKLRDAVPEPIQKHAVRVNGAWYPVKKVIGLAGRVPRADVISTEARRVFRSLGFEVRP